MITMFETQTRSVPISKEMVREAYRKVRANQGAAGVDRESLAEFESNLLGNLYVLWNRLSSGSYFPKPVRSVLIPKSKGKTRELGIPTVSDRIAQQVVKDYLEPRLEEEFHENSYGYRPLKSAHNAISEVQKNVRTHGWVIDMDIKNFFDEVDHELLMKALDRHVSEKWVKMYILRWLQSPKQQPDGSLVAITGKGTPQGGVISPLLANLFLHYVLDKWLEKSFPHLKFVRYADDVIIHCKTEEESLKTLALIKDRLHNCKLRLSEEKSKIVQCKDYRQNSKRCYSKKFDFLGFTFKPMSLSSNKGGMFLGYGSMISQKSQTKIQEYWAKEKWHRRSELSIQEIASKVNPQSVGIFRYYGKFKIHHLQSLFRNLEYRIVKWALNKYKSFKKSLIKGYNWIKDLRKSYPNMFYYWTIFKAV